jgi:MFS family permease
MTRRTLFIAYYLAIFLQAGTYGLTFLLPPLFATFGGTETDVGFVLGITAISTIITIRWLGGLLGVGWGLYYVLTLVVLTQLIVADERVRAFTLLSLFVMAGFGLSPVLGGSLVKLGYGIEFAFILLGLLCLISGGIFWILKSAVATHSITSAKQENSELSISIALQVLRTKH